jgi:hypothetical protein
MAYRMQSSVPELTDLAKEPQSVHGVRHRTRQGVLGVNPAERRLLNAARFVQPTIAADTTPE